MTLTCGFLFPLNYLSGLTGNECLVAKDKKAALQPNAPWLEPGHFRPLQSPLETLRQGWERSCVSKQAAQCASLVYGAGSAE